MNYNKNTFILIKSIKNNPLLKQSTIKTIFKTIHSFINITNNVYSMYYYSIDVFVITLMYIMNIYYII